MLLHTLKPSPGSHHRRKRVGRGTGSGHGAFSTRGGKGQTARAGGVKGPPFEGGQMPLLRRQPKLKGFRNPTKERFEIIHLASLEKRLPPGSYDVFALKEARLVQGRLPVKILGGGRVTKKFTLTVDAVSQSAKKAIEEAGGSITFGEHVRD